VKLGNVYDIYRWGTRSRDKTVERLKLVLNDSEIAELAGILIGARDCSEVEDRIRPWFAWKGLGWVYNPSGPPPTIKMYIMLEVICRDGVPIDEEFLKELATISISEEEEAE